MMEEYENFKLGMLEQKRINIDVLLTEYNVQIDNLMDRIRRLRENKKTVEDEMDILRYGDDEE